ncbi:MAG: DUF4340 domain-containing protein, partial [Myxococcales bacterium]|nr:DUF4340 domain-containing protein [Myxococcales bacterium]
MTRLRRLALAATVVGGGGIAAAVALSVGTKNADERRIERVDRERVYSFGAVDVASVTLRRKDAMVQFQRDDGRGFVLTSPVRWPADAEAIDALLHQVSALREKRTVYERPSPADLEEAGLAKPDGTLELVMKDGTSHRLAIGSVNALTGLLHVRVDEGAVVVVDPSFRWVVDRAMDEFRASRVFPFSEKDVQSVTVRGRDGIAHRATRQPPQGFFIQTIGTRAPPALADEGRFAVFLTAVTKRLEVESFLRDDVVYPELPEGYDQVVDARSVTVDTGSGEDPFGDDRARHPKLHRGACRDRMGRRQLRRAGASARRGDSGVRPGGARRPLRRALSRVRSAQLRRPLRRPAESMALSPDGERLVPGAPFAERCQRARDPGRAPPPVPPGSYEDRRRRSDPRRASGVAHRAGVARGHPPRRAGRADRPRRLRRLGPPPTRSMS